MGIRTGGIKRTAADDWFSKCVRERAGWKCEICGNQHPEEKAPGLDCAHIWGRRNYSTRFDPDNAIAACMACHIRFDGDSDLKVKVTEGVFGQGHYDVLRNRANNTSLGKEYRRALKDVSRHFREEYRRLRADRVWYRDMRLEFVPYL